MKARNFLIVPLLAAIFFSQTAVAHDNYVHQKTVKDAYYFLESQKGAIPALRDRIGLDYSGNGDPNDPWTTGLVVVGAGREDEEDPVWGYCLSNGWAPSSSHFWEAGAGDNSMNPIALAPDVYNAYYKARVYLFGYNNTSVLIRKTQIASDLGGQVINGRVYRWNSLIDLYQNGHIYEVGYYDLNCIYHQYSQQYEKWIDLATARKWACIALGRAAHLLLDMCVPAHAHVDWHPSYDLYEAFINQNITNTIYDAAIPYAGYINAGYAATQGGLLDAYSCVPSGDPGRVVRYLYYTANRLAARFPSDEANGNLNYYTSYNGDNYSVLNMIQGITWTTEMGHLEPIQFSRYTMRYAIRATAELFYWFATETGMLNKVTVSNSFGAGTVTVDGKVVSSGYIKGVNGGVSMHVVAPTSQNINGWLYTFSGWQQLDANGNVIAGSSSADWTVAINGKGTLRANYINPLQATLTGPTNLQWGQTGTYTTSASGGYPPYNYAWWIQYPGGGDMLAGGEETEERIVPDAPPPGDTWYPCGANSPNFTHTCYESFGVKCYVTDSHQTTVLAGPRYNYLGGGGAMMAKEGAATVQADLKTLAEEIPTESSLAPAYPNPFNPSTTLRFALKESAHVILAIYDALGREIAVLARATHGAGYYQYTWNAEAASSGIYFARLTTDTGDKSTSLTRMTKLLLVK